MSTLSPFSLFRYLKPYWVQCIVGPLFKLAEAVLELYMPFLLAQVIDRGIATGDYTYVRRMAFVLVGIVAIGLGMALVCQYLASKISQGFGTTLRNELFAKIMAFFTTFTQFSLTPISRNVIILMFIERTNFDEPSNKIGIFNRRNFYEKRF